MFKIVEEDTFLKIQNLKCTWQSGASVSSILTFVHYNAKFYDFIFLDNKHTIDTHGKLL